MVVVACPNCQKRYDPRIDDALDAAGDGSEISLKVACPNCSQWVRLPAWECVEPPSGAPEMISRILAQGTLLPDTDTTPLTFGPGVVYRPRATEPRWDFFQSDDEIPPEDY